MSEIDFCCENPVYVHVGQKHNRSERIWRCYSCGSFFHVCEDLHFGIYNPKPEDEIKFLPVEQERDALKKELDDLKFKTRKIGCWDDEIPGFRDLYKPDFDEEKYKDVFPILLKEIEHSCNKYPKPDNTVPALLEEVGEFSEENTETKRRGGNHELIQIACVALRLYVDGDPAYDPEHIEKVSELVEKAIKLGKDAREYLIGIGFPE
jgi:hypothetical protein